MAINDIVQTVADARVDARSLSDFVFKPAGFKVPRRLAPPIDTLQFYIDRFDATKATTDAYITTIPSIVNDAINNTAVEGGVLADTFVTATAYGSGSIARTQREINAERVSVHDFGAIGDGTLHTVAEWIPSRFTNLAAIKVVYPHVTALTDSIDWAAIQACINYVKTLPHHANVDASGAFVEGAKGAIYCINKQVDMEVNADFSGNTFLVSTDFIGKAVSINSLTVGLPIIRRLDITMPRIILMKPYDVLHKDTTGVYLEGIRNCEITFDEVWGFKTNLHLYSNLGTRFISYNNFHFTGLFVESLTNIWIQVEGSGWINQCQWFGGQFARFGSQETLYPNSIINIRISKTLGSNNAPNGHTFWGCSLEGGFWRTIDYDYDPAITTSFFSSNAWVNCRFEGAKAFKFSSMALYDNFNGCRVDGDSVFVDDIRPEMFGGTRQRRALIDTADIINTVRKPKHTNYFAANSGGSGMVITTGVSERINAAITAGGSFNAFHPTLPENLYPSTVLDYQGILFGSGVTQAVDKMYSSGTGQVRHTFNLYPQAGDTLNLGNVGLAYKGVYATNAYVTKSIGLWGVTPPTSKPSVTGLKTPTTIAEQKVVTDSLIAAMVSYGLITDSRT